MPRTPHLLVMLGDLRIEYHGEEQSAYELLFEHLRGTGHEFTVITWDRDQSVLDLDDLGRVHYVEDINRWRLPTWLATHRLRAIARRLRHARMRWWWRGAGHPRAVLVLGPIRAELTHYAPPGAHVGVVLGWREFEDELLEATLRFADAVVADDEETVQRCRAVGPGADVRHFPDLWPHLHWSLHPPLPACAAPARAGIAADATFVLGLGPIDWGGGAEQFVAVAGRLRQAMPGRRLRFGWIGGTPTGPYHFPYRFDVERLGLGDTFAWLGERDDFYEFVRRADAVVLTCRRPFELPYDPTVGWFVAANREIPATFTPLDEPFAALLDVLEVPVVRSDLDASHRMTLGRGTAVTYPDTATMTESVRDLLEAPRATTVGEALAHLLGEPVS